ncbi:MAG: UDP-N-acetylglucosamine 2-epimerase, partial [Candidatus Riflebacteria bacterium]|nr:UDP-N-acetylglucosamine 2-epimerase [Candidatus Riflebacteria bacterium]
MAPLVSRIRRHPSELDAVVVATAQHRQMLDSVLHIFSIRPDHDLDLMRPDQDLFHVTSRGLTELGAVLKKVRPHLVLVQGDTTTSLVGAMAGFYLKIPIGHVEAGLRTRCKHNPFPEEMNRHLVSVMADVHFAPTVKARRNLLDEGVPARRILVTG